MPYRTLDMDEVADYLHLSRADIERLVNNRDIPVEKTGNRLLFRKVEIDDWASRRILGLESKPLAGYHRKTSNAARQWLRQEALLPQCLQPQLINPALPAKTKASVLREMALLAEKSGRVTDGSALLESLKAREELCSTGIPGGLALIHARHPDPYLFEAPLIAVGRTVQEIPFGSPDRKKTDLFFLLGCPDERIHLHLLARLCLMAQKTDFLAQLRQADTAEAMHEVMLACEQAVLEKADASS